MTAAKKLESDPKKAIESLASIVSGYAGIHLGERQLPMVQSRLRKRMSELKIDSFEQYLRYVYANFAEETKMLVSLLTTHHTFFFREFFHFEMMERQMLPIVIESLRARGQKVLRVWSAACSRGQEVYSLAMFLDHYLKLNAPDLSYEVVGSDVDSESVRIAENGVYHRNEIKDAPLHFLANHWTRGKGEISDYVKANTSLRQRVQFRSLNLFELGTASGLGKFDIIFCRNVFIYFNQAQIQRITLDLKDHLHDQGYLFLGISEGLHGLDVGLQSLGSSVYSKQALGEAKPPHLAIAVGQSAGGKRVLNGSVGSSSILLSPAKKLRVLVVDDSVSIHTLMKRILVEESGFEIVGFASNGIEAHQLRVRERPDVMTLDIHMPEMDGIEYLKSHYNNGHPPVVMVSSVAREDSGLALKALSLGASDYVEKPAINTMLERGEEICNKLRSAFAIMQTKSASRSTVELRLEKEFAQGETIKSPGSFIRVVVTEIGEQVRLQALLADLEKFPGATVVLAEGAGSVLEEWCLGVSRSSRFDLAYTDNLEKMRAVKGIPVNHFKPGIEQVFRRYTDKYVALMCLGTMSSAVENVLKTHTEVYVLLEELGVRNETVLVKAVNDVVPLTSFAYMANHNFIKVEKKLGRYGLI